MLSGKVHSSVTWDQAFEEMDFFKGIAVKGVDTTTIDGKIVCGYQGWFNTPSDGLILGWKHYPRHDSLNSGSFRPGNASIEFWPHTAELPDDALASTPWRKRDGTTAKVYSSAHPGVVLKHFEWMEAYGIEAVFLQRFAGLSTRDPARFRNNNRVLANVRSAANATGRAYVVMYDGDIRDRRELERLKRDWRLLVDKMGITRDPNDKAYLHHRGKPLVAFWGFGFYHRNTDLKLAQEFVEWLKHDPEYGGNSVMLGIPSGFRELISDSVADPELHRLIEKADIVSPWSAGRYDMEILDAHTEEFWLPDLEWCNERGIDYLPCVFPGFSWANYKGTLEISDQIPRHRGRFYWKQFANLIENGVRQIYVGMFDEIDEGTQILKIDNNPPVSKKEIFLSYYPDPEDHYLWLTGIAQEMLSRTIPFDREFPERQTNVNTDILNNENSK